MPNVSDVSCMKNVVCLAHNRVVHVAFVMLVYLPFNCNAFEFAMHWKGD